MESSFSRKQPNEQKEKQANCIMYKKVLNGKNRRKKQHF